ncbi:hypothetical protein LR48_Vigan746s000100 [Vigna angularis]|uniref:Uncharacterized protein n=1 Tax=Phaseolus angularis TaxID=3914 RepID=A0A0L9TGH3_PHAAN|nr:hypothetical protein LR48_Vigan746s000100 [Vigna angularis]
MKCCTHLSGALSSNTRSPAKKRSLVQLVGRRSSNTQNPIAWKQVRQLDCSRSTFKRQHPAWRSTVKHDGSREKEESSSWKLEETHGGCWKRRRRRADSWLGMDSSQDDDQHLQLWGHSSKPSASRRDHVSTKDLRRCQRIQRALLVQQPRQSGQTLASGDRPHWHSVFTTAAVHVRAPRLLDLFPVPIIIDDDRDERQIPPPRPLTFRTRAPSTELTLRSPPSNTFPF